MRTIPNIMTILRICSLPFLIWAVLRDWYVAAFILLLAAGISDAIDGVIARRFKWQSKLGRVLDPLADKLLGASIYSSFSLKGVVPPWLGALVIGRDVIISLGALVLLLLGMKVVVNPSALGKRTTGWQIGTAALAMLSVLPHAGPFVKDLGVLPFVFFVAGALTVASGTHYLYRSFKDYDNKALLKDIYRLKEGGS